MPPHGVVEYMYLGNQAILLLFSMNTVVFLVLWTFRYGLILVMICTQYQSKIDYSHNFFVGVNFMQKFFFS